SELREQLPVRARALVLRRTGESRVRKVGGEASDDRRRVENERLPGLEQALAGQGARLPGARPVEARALSPPRVRCVQPMPHLGERKLALDARARLPLRIPGFYAFRDGKNRFA